MLKISSSVLVEIRYFAPLLFFGMNYDNGEIGFNYGRGDGVAGKFAGTYPTPTNVCLTVVEIT